jgi:hypothetical protein
MVITSQPLCASVFDTLLDAVSSMSALQLLLRCYRSL